MRKLLLLLVASLCLLSVDAVAQNYIQVVAVADNVGAGKFKSTKLNCPAGYIPIAFGWGPKHADKVVYAGSGTIDNTGKVVDVTDLADGSSMIGGGYQLTVQSSSTVAEDYVLQVICQKVTGTVTYVKQTTMVAPGATGNLTGFCAAGWSATGTLSNIGQSLRYDMGDAPVWTGPNYLGNVVTPTMPAPTGWEITATNKGSAQSALTQMIICQMLPANAMTFIYSKTITAGMRYALPLPVPDGYLALSIGFDGYPYNAPYGRLDTWHANWRVPSQEFAGTQTGVWGQGIVQTIDSAAIQFYRYAGDLRAPPPPPPYAFEAKAGNVVVGAVLAIPSGNAPPAATVANVVEFYNQALDHYFITAAPGEISDLDNGVHKGWARTGQSFHTYAAGSTGRPGRQPVCRAYGNPAVGLDSHFYSASEGECFDTLGKFAGAWLLEASEVFQMDLPDTTTGACPAGDVPVYRVFNNRADANHRYTTSTAIRDQMVARGYIAEGYGPNNVTLCALP